MSATGRTKILPSPISPVCAVTEIVRATELTWSLQSSHACFCQAMSLLKAEEEKHQRTDLLKIFESCCSLIQSVLALVSHRITIAAACRLPLTESLSIPGDRHLEHTHASTLLQSLRQNFCPPLAVSLLCFPCFICYLRFA